MEASSFARVRQLLTGRAKRRGTAIDPHAAVDIGTLAQEGAPFTDGERQTFLFVHSYQSAEIASTDGAAGRYSITLSGGPQQTVYFSDRPDRDVGVVATGRFLDGLGFAADNPPNAALLVETADGETAIAVVELFDPVYDEAAGTTAFAIEPLAEWRQALDLSFSEAPGELDSLTSATGPAHLFIDDCAAGVVWCERCESGPDCGTEYPYKPIMTPFCWDIARGDSACRPCIGPGNPQGAPEDRTQAYWSMICNQWSFADWCGGQCHVSWSTEWRAMP